MRKCPPPGRGGGVRCGTAAVPRLTASASEPITLLGASQPRASTRLIGRGRAEVSGAKASELYPQVSTTTPPQHGHAGQFRGRPGGKRTSTRCSVGDRRPGRALRPCARHLRPLEEHDWMATGSSHDPRPANSNQRGARLRVGEGALRPRRADVGAGRALGGLLAPQRTTAASALAMQRLAPKTSNRLLHREGVTAKHALPADVRRSVGDVPRRVLGRLRGQGVCERCSSVCGLLSALASEMTSEPGFRWRLNRRYSRERCRVV